MKKVVFILSIAFLAMGTTFAQEKKVVESKAEKVESTRGADPNIVVDRSTEDVAEPNPATARGGETYCKVYIDNKTGYKIDVYLDGEYKGTVPAWKKQYSWVIAGRTSFYAKTTGGTYKWKATYFDCDFEYTWTLTVE